MSTDDWSVLDGGSSPVILLQIHASGTIMHRRPPLKHHRHMHPNIYEEKHARILPPDVTLLGLHLIAPP